MKIRHPGIASFGALALLGGFAVFHSASMDRVPPDPPAGTVSQSLEADGRTRTYLLHLPPRYDGHSSLPLVLVLHGGGQGPESAERMSGMSAKADQENFMAVYPSGTGRLNKMPTWNSGNCCGYAMENHVDDVGFLRALIEKLERDNSADSKRVFVTGISNGGMMSYRAACELADKIAAIAPVEGAQNVDCGPSAPVSVLVFHGTADHLVPFEGGTTRFQIGPVRSDNSVAAAVAFWVKQDGCSPAPHHQESSEGHVDTYSGCKAGSGVQLYAIQGGRHMWPGAAISGNHVAATNLMWTFFSQHPKP